MKKAPPQTPPQKLPKLGWYSFLGVWERQHKVLSFRRVCFGGKNAAKANIAGTFFAKKVPTVFYSSLPARRREIYSLGERPTVSRNTLEKYRGSWKPQRRATFFTDSTPWSM